MNRPKVAFAALAGVLVGCGSGHERRAVPPLSRDEVRALYRTHGAVRAYCSASIRFASVVPGDAKASLRASDGLAEQRAVTSAALARYMVVLRAHPDARPPSDDPLMDATPREDAEHLNGQLADCTTATAKGAARRWRAHLHTVLAGLPPTRSQ